MFVHLRLHTEFSVVDSTIRVDAAAEMACADGQGALAITDLNNLFATVKFYRACRDLGVKPLVGAEVSLEGLGADAAQGSRIVLLVQNAQGYLNLSELLARAHTQNGAKAQITVRWQWLAELHEGLICLSGAQAGPVGMPLVQGDTARAHEAALQLSTTFPHRFYLELQRAGRPEDAVQVAGAVRLAARLNFELNFSTRPAESTKRFSPV